MAMWLKQSTAVTVKMGPFLDSTDGATAETGLTISQADIRLSKNGGNIAQSNNAAGATHDELGYYDVPLDTTDTNTLGTLRVLVTESGALPVWQDFMVVPANVWDSLFGADKLQVHADEITAGLITAAAIATNAIDADALASDAVTEIQSGLATAAALAMVDGIVDAILVDTGTTLDGKLNTIDGIVDSILEDTGTTLPASLSALPTAAANADAVWDEARSSHATAGTFGEGFQALVHGQAITGTLSTTQMTTNLSEATNDHYNGRIVVFITGALSGQATDITDYTGATKLITMTALTESPANGDRFVIV